MPHQVTSSRPPLLASLGHAAPSCTEQAFGKGLQSQGVPAAWWAQWWSYKPNGPRSLPSHPVSVAGMGAGGRYCGRGVFRRPRPPKVIFLRSLHQAAKINLLFLGIINFANQHSEGVDCRVLI